MPNKKKETKKALLGELESIKDLLIEEDIPILEPIVTLDNTEPVPPLLTDTLQATTEPPLLNTPLSNTSTESTSTLPDQQALFDDPIKPRQQTKNPTATKRKPVVQAQGENPFLPQHIRSRLHTTKTLIDQIKESPSFQEVTLKLGSPAPEAFVAETVAETMAETIPEILTTDPPTPQQEQEIIEQLIATFMPQIEQALRQKLQVLAQTDEKLSNDTSPNE